MEKLKQRLSLAVRYSDLAYGEPEHAAHQRLISDPSTDAQVMVSKLPKGERYDAVVAFRGTSSRRDALADINIRRHVPWYLSTLHPPVRVHSGFANQYEGVRAPLMKWIDEHDPKRVMVTGHSLGSIACLFALDLAIHKPNVDVDCVTFGSPRIGGREFARKFDLLVDRCTRVVHNRDVVTCVPMPFRFAHVGTPLRLRTRGHSRGPVDDHSLEHYKRAVECMGDDNDDL